MSHSKERKEKTCLNCNAHIYGRYCHICGQENIEAKQTFGHLVTHFIYDVTHFDGKFFITLKDLLFRPGFLSKEFLRGRRVSYLDPIRMYVFTSAIFFLIFFSFKSGNEFVIKDSTPVSKDSTIAALQQVLNKTDDSLAAKIIRKQIDALKKANDTTGKAAAAVDSPAAENQNIFLGSVIPETVDEYEKQQKKLPEEKKDGWFKHNLTVKAISINKDYKTDKNEFQRELKEKLAHAFPQMMFVSLPLAALILQLLYVRRRKQFYYVSHGIFTVHVYIATYILLLIIYGFGALRDITHWSLFSWLYGITFLLIFFYLYKAMHNFYAQSRVKTLLKMSLFLLLYLIVIVLLIIVFFIISLLQL